MYKELKFNFLFSSTLYTSRPHSDRCRKLNKSYMESQGGEEKSMLAHVHIDILQHLHLESSRSNSSKSFFTSPHQILR